MALSRVILTRHKYGIIVLSVFLFPTYLPPTNGVYVFYMRPCLQTAVKILSFHAFLDCVFLFGEGSKVIFVAVHKWRELNSMKLLLADEILNCKRSDILWKSYYLMEVNAMQKRNSKERRLCSIR